MKKPPFLRVHSRLQINASHEASRKKFTVVLSMTSMKGYPAAPETVIFAFPTGGRHVTKALEQEKQNVTPKERNSWAHQVQPCW